MTAIAKKLLAAKPDLLSEAEFSGLVLDVARLGGWTRRYHTFNSKRSAGGFPDWVFLKTDPPRLLFVELKTDAGKVRADQQAWIDDLQRFALAVAQAITDSHLRDYDFAEAPVVEAHIWRPGDWPSIVETLTGRKPTARSAAA